MQANGVNDWDVTLRFYHEQGLLVPSFVDPNSGYRYYAWEQIETARLIAQLSKHWNNSSRKKGRPKPCQIPISRFRRRRWSRCSLLCGKPLMLHYDDEYREDDANFEPCMPVRQAKQVPEIDVRELPGGRCVSLIHKGPYEQLGRSYAKITKYIKDKDYKIMMPTREVYLKGPGIIFKGNPANYLTEIQMLVLATRADDGASSRLRTVPAR